MEKKFVFRFEFDNNKGEISESTIEHEGLGLVELLGYISLIEGNLQRFKLELLGEDNEECLEENQMAIE